MQGQVDPAMTTHGIYQLKEDLAVQSMYHVMMLEPEYAVVPGQPVQQEGADYTQRRTFRVEIQRSFPAVQINSVFSSGIHIFLSPFTDPQKAQGLIFLQLLAQGGYIQHLRLREMGQILYLHFIHQFHQGQLSARRKAVHYVKMQCNILVREAFGFESIVQRIMLQTAAVQADENLLSGFLTAKGHVRSQPAFDPAALVVIATGAFHSHFGTTAEAKDVKLPHIVPDALKILDQLAVFHTVPLFLSRFSIDSIGYFSYKSNHPFVAFRATSVLYIYAILKPD